MTAASRPCSSPLPSGPSSKAPPGSARRWPLPRPCWWVWVSTPATPPASASSPTTAPVAFGAIGIPIVVAAGVTGLNMMHISQIVGRQLPFLSLIVPLWLSVTMCGWSRSLEVLPAIIVAGVCFAVSQFFVSNFIGPYLPDIISAIVTIVGLGIFLRLWKPRRVFHFADEKPAGPVSCQYSASEVVRAGPLTSSWPSWCFCGAWSPSRLLLHAHRHQV